LAGGSTLHATEPFRRVTWVTFSFSITHDLG
jgi:hypothetical protein